MVVDRGHGEVERAQADSAPVPESAATVRTGEAGGDEEAGQEWNRVKGVGDGDGAPGDAHVGEGCEDLGSVSGETIEQDMGEEAPKKQRHPAPRVRVRRLPRAVEVATLAVPPPPRPHERDVQGDREPRAGREDLG